MSLALSSGSRPVLARRRARAGITLVEVLVAIFITGVGLLALLTLFPLGAMEMARATQDDRAAAIARDAATLSEDGLELLSRTRRYVLVSLSRRSADPQTAATLQKEYEELGAGAADLEGRLGQLQPNVTDPRIQRLLQRLLAQSRSIRVHSEVLADLLGLLTGPQEIPTGLGAAPRPL